MQVKEQKICQLAEHKIVNFMISDKRAHSVANIFIEKHGFPRNKSLTEAVSDSKPLFKEIMPAGTKANQRTEIFPNLLILVSLKLLRIAIAGVGTVGTGLRPFNAKIKF